jgi:hypothetical protein
VQATGDREGLGQCRPGPSLLDVAAFNRRGGARADNSVVRFGRAIFRIVGEDEANPARGTISQISPLARLLFGKGVGDVVSVAGSDAENLERALKRSSLGQMLGQFPVGQSVISMSQSVI